MVGRTTDRLDQLSRIRKELIDMSFDRTLPKEALRDLDEAEWHISSARHTIITENRRGTS